MAILAMSGWRQSQWLWPWIVLAFAGLAIVFLWTWFSETSASDAIRALPDTQRRGLYLRTMENLRTVCEPAAPRAMRDFCREQASLAERFPECDASCAEIAHRHRTMPTR